MLRAWEVNARKPQQSAESSSTEEDSFRGKDPRKAKGKATLADEWDVWWGRPVGMTLFPRHRPRLPWRSCGQEEPSPSASTLLLKAECGHLVELKLKKAENSAINSEYFILMHFKMWSRLERISKIKDIVICLLPLYSADFTVLHMANISENQYMSKCNSVKLQSRLN